MIEKKYSQLFFLIFGIVLLSYVISYNFLVIFFPNTGYTDIIGSNIFSKKIILLILFILSLILCSFSYLKIRKFSFNHKIAIYFIPTLLMIVGLYGLRIEFYGQFMQIYLLALSLAFFIWIVFREYLNNIKINKYLPYTIAIIFIGIYSIVSISIHNHYQSHAMDFGLYTQAFWNYAHLNLGPSTIKGAYYLLGDHFILLFPLLSPIYRLLPFPQTLLIMQSIFVCAGSIPIYLLGKKILKKDFSALMISMAYLLFIGLQSALTFGIHGATFIPTFFAFAFWFLNDRKWIWYWVFIILALISKEDAPILISCFGLFILFFTKDKKIGVITTILGLSWYFAVSNFIIPALNSSGKFDYFQYAALGKNPSEAVKTMITNPLFVLKSILSNITKLDTLLKYFISFGFLTIFTPEVLLFLGLPIIMEQFLNDSPLRWGVIFHYPIAITPILAIGAIIGISRLNKFGELLSLRYKINLNQLTSFFALLVIFCSFSVVIWQRSPILDIFKKKTYTNPSWAQDINKAILTVPKDASVSTQHSIVPHLANRAKIYQRPLENTPDALSADYLVLSLYGSTWPLDENQQIQFIKDHISGGEGYGLFKQVNGTFVFKKGYETDQIDIIKANNYLENYESQK